MFNQDTSRPNKEMCVEAFFSQFDKPVENYVCLPAKNLRCIKKGMELGIINRNTHIVCIEQSESIAREIKKGLKSLGFKSFVVHNKKIQFTTISTYIECGYFDLCGQISTDFLFWLNNLNIREDAKLAFTFAASPRCPKNTPSFYYQVCSHQYLAISYPLYTPGLHETSDPIKEDKLSLVAGLLSDQLPTIKFNITQYYNDTHSPMLFLGGYFGSDSLINVKENSVVKSLEERIVHLAKHGVERHQQIGGLKISYNKLTSGKKAALRRKYGKQMAKLGL